MKDQGNDPCLTGSEIQMTRNQQVREAQSARGTKTADEILAKYRAIGPAAVLAALCCAKRKAFVGNGQTKRQR